MCSGIPSTFSRHVTRTHRLEERIEPWRIDFESSTVFLLFLSLPVRNSNFDGSSDFEMSTANTNLTLSAGLCQGRTTRVRLVPEPRYSKAARNHVFRFPSRHRHASHLCPFETHAKQRVPLPSYGSLRKRHRRHSFEKVQALVGKDGQQDLLEGDVDG